MQRDEATGEQAWSCEFCGCANEVDLEDEELPKEGEKCMTCGVPLPRPPRARPPRVRTHTRRTVARAPPRWHSMQSDSTWLLGLTPFLVFSF